MTRLGDTWRKRVLSIALVALTGAVAALTFVATGTSYFASNLVVAGVVRDAAGNPVSGARVALYDAQPDGDDTVVQSPLATTTSAADGSYALSLTPTAALTAEAGGNGGFYNFYLAATAGSSPYFVGITRAYAAGRWQNADGTAVDGSNASARDDLTAAAGASVGAGMGPNLHCGIEIRKKRLAEEQALTVIGETHVVKDMREDFTYGATADSDIDIGVSFDNQNWSVNGSFHVGNQLGASIKWYVTPEDGHEWRSNFVYRKYKHWDFCGNVWYSVTPRKWTGGGAWPGADDSYLDHRCLSWYASTTQNYGPGQEFTRSAKKLNKFGFAVTVFGVTLGARSGSSRYVVSHWKFGTGQQNHFLCGSNAQPASAKRIFAGA